MRYRTIGPEEAEMMVAIRRLERDLAPERRYPTGKEIATAMNAEVEKIRSMVSALNSGGHEYVSSDVRLKKRQLPGQPKKRGAPPVTYHLAEMFMVRWPKTGLFLTCAVEFAKDDDTSVNEKDFLDHMSARFERTLGDMQEDLSWCARTHYIHRFPGKKPTTFQLTSRTYAEINWLEALGAEFKLKQKN
jgi:hypothetical protein